jgi:hypothetical protein
MEGTDSMGWTARDCINDIKKLILWPFCLFPGLYSQVP